MSDIRYKVYAYCATYNQSSYIKDALDGFCMQKTNFPFVCAIKDDASTDGEPEIIRQYLEDNFDFTDGSVAYKKETEYGQVIFAQHKHNKNCYFAVVLLKENHYSQKKDPSPYFQEWRDGVPYLALCEGDDYWIDPLKLQKQVDFLEANPDCSAIFGNRLTIKGDVGFLQKTFFKKNKYDIFDVCSGLMPGIQNTMFVSSVSDKPIIKNINGDICYYYYASLLGKLAYVNEDFAVYRITGKGVATGRDPKLVWRISIEHRYKFHEAISFSQNRALVKGQIFNVLNRICHGGSILEAYRLLREFSSPSLCRYYYYFIYSVQYIYLAVTYRLLNKSNVTKI